jgi:hypothetical protein
VAPISNDNTPVIEGVAELGSLLSLFTNASCSGAPFATGRVVAASGRISITVPAVPSDAVTTFHATATDVAGNTSGCSQGLAYTEDSTPPAPPTLQGTTPASPSQATAFRLTGTTEPRGFVAILPSGSICDGPKGYTQADDSGHFSIDMTVTSNSVNNYYAIARDRAGNESGCGAMPWQYVSDSLPPSLSLAQVRDGDPDDVAWSTDPTRATASWDGFTDPTASRAMSTA